MEKEDYFAYINIMLRIQDISFLKNDIKLTIINDKALESFIIDKEIFSNHFLYVNKELSADEFDKIKKEVYLKNIRNKVVKKIINKPLSTYEVRQFLKNESLDEENINLLINYLSEIHLIDDENLTKDLISIYENKNYSYQKIKMKLKQRGLETSLKEDISLEEKKAEEIFNSYYRTIKKYSLKEQKTKMNDYLIRQGFSPVVKDKVIEKLFVEDDDLEDENLKRTINLYLVKHASFDNQDRDKLISSFLRKGYKLDKIKKILENIDK